MQIETEIKKWGNSLALRITNAIAGRHRFEEGCKVLVDATDEGLLIKPVKRDMGIKLPFTEDDLLDGLTSYQAHADELTEPFQDELGD